MSWRQSLRLPAAKLGVERIPDDAMREMLRGAGWSDAQIEGVIGMSTGLLDGFVAEQPRSVHTTTPTTLAAWVYDVLRPQI